MADLTVTLSDHVATVEIQRPPANYFDLALIDALASAYEDLEAEPDCRAIVLGSAGKHFCAGARFGEPSGDAEQDADPVGTDALYARSLALFTLSKPVVAAVQGGAVGGGAGLALSADFRVGEPSSWFAFNFARLGIHQGLGIWATLPPGTGPGRGRRRGRWRPGSRPPPPWPCRPSGGPGARAWPRRCGPRSLSRPSASA